MDMTIFKIIAGIVILSYTIYKFICDIKNSKIKKKRHEEIKKKIIKKYKEIYNDKTRRKVNSVGV